MGSPPSSLPSLSSLCFTLPHLFFHSAFVADFYFLVFFFVFTHRISSGSGSIEEKPTITKKKVSVKDDARTVSIGKRSPCFVFVFVLFFARIGFILFPKKNDQSEERASSKSRTKMKSVPFCSKTE